MKFKFYCPWIVFIGHSHALRFTYCLGLSLSFNDRAEQLGQRPGELQSLQYLLSDPVENVCCSELIEHSSSRESEHSGHAHSVTQFISWLSLVFSRSQSLKKKKITEWSIWWHTHLNCEQSPHFPTCSSISDNIPVTYSVINERYASVKAVRGKLVMCVEAEAL